MHHYLEKLKGYACVVCGNSLQLSYYCFLHSDNCTAQNKNNASMQYLMWHILTGKNESIELSFMLTGHTKFSPNRYFSLLKKVFQWSSVSKLSGIALVVKQSTKKDQNFHVTCEQPGVVYLREFSDSTEVQFNILKTNVDIEELSILPSKTHTPRLDLQHQ